MTSLDTTARNFIVVPKAARHLERHHSAVLTLRAKEATFSQIQEVLAQHSVTVSESSITRFCRKHLAEIQRLRLQLEEEVNLPSGSPSVRATVLAAPPSTPKKMRDLRGPV